MNKIDEYLKHYQDLEIYHKAYKTSYLRKAFEIAKKEEAELIRKVSETSNKDLYQAIYYYLVWNGYFSANGKFKASSNTSIELKTELGISISCGNGCCRNFAPHFKALMELLNSNSNFVLVGTKYHYSQGVLKSTKKIPRRADIESFKTKRKITDYRYPNHVEVLDITNPQSPRVLDPFNFNIQQITTEKESIFRSKMVDFGIAISLDFDMDTELRNTLLANSEALEKTISKKAFEEMSVESRKRLRQEAIYLCEENTDLLENHKKKMNPIYQYIKKETQSFQKSGY